MAPDLLVFERAVDALGWALLHSLWQGAVVATGAAVALALLRRQPASSRYWVAYGALLLTFLLPAATVWQLASTPEPIVAAAGPAVAPAPQPFVDPLLFWTGAAGVLDPLIPWMVVGWLSGVLALSIRLAGGCTMVHRLSRRGTSPPAEGWQRRFAALVERLGVGRPVRLLASAKIAVPTVCGWLRPVVLVPLSTLVALPVEQVESILAHELAHVRRHDYLFNLVQSVIEILLFFHPGVWWLSARVRAERENCCDDVAVATSGDVRVYLRALAALAELRAVASPAPALGATGSPLVARVRRLVVPRQATAGEAGSRLTASVLLLSAALVVGIGVANRVEAAAESALGPDAPPRISTTGLTYRDEMRIASSCAPTEKVVRCLDAAGEIRFECGAKSPLALLWQSLRGPAPDDEVRVVVDRDVPAGVPAGPGAEPAASDPSEITRVVVPAALPGCRTT